MGDKPLENNATPRMGSLAIASWTGIILLSLTALAVYLFIPMQRPLRRHLLPNRTVLEFCSVSGKQIYFRFDRRSRALAWLERAEYQTGFKLPSGGRTKMVTFAGLGKDCGLILRTNTPLVEPRWKFEVWSDDQTTIPIQTTLNYRRQFHLVSIPTLTTASKHLTLQCKFRDGSTHEDVAFEFDNPNFAAAP